MRFDERFLDEIKSRVRLSDVIGKTVKLKRQGREYRGLSPFTKEKTPSFFVNDDKGFWHDFSSGKHGDLIGFLQEVERLSFPEAVERIANEAGVPLPAADPQAAERETKRLGLQEWLDLAAKWFAANLRRPPGAQTRAYLERRGLPAEEWERFGLGYAPASRTGLKDALVQRGAKPGDLVEAGLLISPEGGGQPYDRFRDRIIFPITDSRGRIVSFAGRAMNPDDKAKYLNGPETSLFHKGNLVYGLPEARKLLQSVTADPALVVVEGYMDVIACQRAGIAAVAPMGTALTESQMELLWRFHPEPTLCFDGDKAGSRAAARAIDRALPLLRPGRSFQFALLRDGQDPDDILRDKGVAHLRSLLSQTRPFIDVLYQRELDLEPLDTPERRVGFKVRLRKLAQIIADRDLAEQYRVDLNTRFEATFPRVQFMPGWSRNKLTPHIQGLINKHAAQILRERPKRLNASIVVKAIRNPLWLLPYVEEISMFGFGDQVLKRLVEPIVEGLSFDGCDEKLMTFAISRAQATETMERAFRVTFEVLPPLPFLAPEKDEDSAHRIWRKAVEALIEIEAIKKELEDRSLGLETKGRILWRGGLAARKRLLERALSDYSLWEDEETDPTRVIIEM